MLISGDQDQNQDQNQNQDQDQNQNPNVHPIYLIAPHITLFEMLTGTILGGPSIVVKKEAESSWIINSLFA